MKDALIWIGIIAVFVAGVTGPWLVWRKEDRKFQAKQATWAAEQDAQTIELARQRHLRELEERRRGLLRGRDQPCRFCGLELGCLTLDDVCMDVESCLARAGVETRAADLTN
jgi:hypothetical protein